MSLPDIFSGAFMGYTVLAVPVVFLVFWQAMKYGARAGRLSFRIDRHLADNTRHYIWPGMLETVLSCVRRCATRKEYESLETRLRQAGFFHHQAADIYIGGRLLFVAVAWCACVYFLIAPRTLGDLISPGAVLTQMVVAIISVRGCELWLSSRVRRRLFRIRQQTPQTLELLAICVGVGLTLDRALRRVTLEVRESLPELSVEFGILASELEISEKTLTVLERFRQRCGVEELEMMAYMLMQTVRYGTPLVDSLATIAKQSRAIQRDLIKEKAGAAPARMSVPLMVLIVFPSIILIVAPAVVNFIRSVEGMG